MAPGDSRGTDRVGFTAVPPTQLHTRPVTEFKEASAWLKALVLLSFNS